MLPCSASFEQPCKVITSNALPTEILQNIFLETLPNANEKKLKDDYRSGFLTALRISHVCRRWREASISFGMLWSFFSIESKGAEGRERQKLLLDMFDTWLVRSENSPLNLRVAFAIGYGGDTEMAESIVKSLVSHQHRWRDVKFNLSFHLSANVLDIGLTDMPMLVSLDFFSNIKLGDARWQADAMHYRVDIGNSVLIQELNLRGTYSIEYGEQPIHTLTRVSHRPRKVSMLEVAESYILKLLRFAPKLRELSVEIHHDSGLPPERAPMVASNILVHGIHKLAINDVRGHLASFVLPKVTLPSLKCLRYTGGSQAGDSAVTDLVLRSLPRLESLGIMSGSSSQDALVPTLRLLPTLETIRIPCAGRLSWFFRELANDHEGRKTCPALRGIVVESLLVVGDNDRDETLHSLCEMLNSQPGRWTAVRINRKKFEIPPHSSGGSPELFSGSLVTRRYNSLEVLGRQGHEFL